eukprot:9678825-Ditylum_brightwellii.AAC.1
MENLGNYVTKHHAPTHHIKICPLYLHSPTSPRFLPRTLSPSVLRGCVDPALAERRPVRTQDRTLAGALVPTALAFTLYARVPRVLRPATL